MDLDWRSQSILRRLEEGYTLQQAAIAGKISRQAIWKRMKSSPEFAEAVVVAREVGKDEREFRMWLRHPFRGRRPPTSKAHGGKPVFTYGVGARSRRPPHG
jgi:hypothetical protein